MYNLLAQTNITSLIIFGVLAVGIIGLFIWSSIRNKKQQKQAQEALNNIKIGDRVKTIGGICGFIVEINDAENTFVLETGSSEVKNCIKFDKGAIYQTAPAKGNAVEEKATEQPKPAQEEKPAKAPAKKDAEKQAK